MNDLNNNVNSSTNIVQPHSLEADNIPISKTLINPQ